VPRSCVGSRRVVQRLDKAIDVLLHASAIIRDSAPPVHGCRACGPRAPGDIILAS
jgi:hypothetical protein